MLEASTNGPVKPRGERAQQHRRAEVVVGDVVGDVAEVDAEPDHRRLVADRRDAVDRARDHVRIADVALDQLGARVEVVRPLAVRGLEQDVSSTRTSRPAREQRVDDVRADEAGAAGDEDRAGHDAPGYSVRARARRDPAGPQRARRDPVGARADARRLRAAGRRQRLDATARARSPPRSARAWWSSRSPGFGAACFAGLDRGGERDRVLHGLRRVVRSGRPAAGRRSGRATAPPT